MASPLRIAAADDDPRIRSFYEVFVPLLGHRLIGCADSGEALLRICHERWPDLVITDIRMGSLDGLSAVARLNREHPTPVIVVSAYDEDLNADRTEQPWIRARLLKPVKEQDLQRAIEAAAEGAP